ncbi:MAG: hypothetical protein KC473_09725 [Candidatus Dadabacteria bacterium]|nr:hypothetical protein [Candidatus Dadabacteria bacterium]
MLQDSLSKFKYFLVLALLAVLPMQAFAGSLNNFYDPIDNTDTGADRLIYYYDQLGRETFVQVTNTSDSFLSIHVQVFEADQFCNEVDFDDFLTPGETVVYDMAALPGNPDLTDSYGFVSITLDTTDSFVSGALIGSFRIIDSEGYEYRTNAASSDRFGQQDPFIPGQFENALNFNNVNDPAFADVVGITYVDLLDGRNVYASPGVGTQFGAIGSGDQNLIFDHAENFNSCSPVTFACDPDSINLGIDNSVPNTQGFARICNTSKLEGDNLPVDSGWLLLPFIGNICVDPLVAGSGTGSFEGECDFPTYFVGFLGLNNGDGTGSMDSWLSDPIFLEAVIVPPLAETAAE